MTNKEFYGDRLLAVALEDACHKLHKAVHGESCMGNKKCEDCEFDTIKDVEIWLNAEHEELESPLLENGDELKPGNFLMVRDSCHDKWCKRVFLCYKSGYFVMTDNGDPIGISGVYTAWNQARLPMEGE